MLSTSQIKSLIGEMWLMQQADMRVLDRVRGYTRGELGRPEVPENASDEVKALAPLSVMNVLEMVRDSFANSLAVVGYRAADAQENDPAWAIWQANRLDARQAAIYRPAVTYGSAYALVVRSADGPVIRTRSPRQILAVYDDPEFDLWPQYALQTWTAYKDAKPWRRATLFDREHLYQLDLGPVPAGDAITGQAAAAPPSVREVDKTSPHGGMFAGQPVCPVVRFLNDPAAEDVVHGGEIEPLIVKQRALNAVNFDRLIVSRYAATPDKVITGWQGTKAQVAEAGATRVMSFADPDVKAQSFPAADMGQYDDTLNEMLSHIVLSAGMSAVQAAGKLVNVGADTLAAADLVRQGKLAAKRDSFGESWEQVMRLCAAMDGDAATAEDSAAEVVWRDTEARTFAAVVDGVTKLAAAGVPLEPMLPLIPGLTQSQVQSIKSGMRAQRTTSLVERLTAGQQQPIPAPPDVLAASAA